MFSHPRQDDPSQRPTADHISATVVPSVRPSSQPPSRDSAVGGPYITSSVKLKIAPESY